MRILDSFIIFVASRLLPKRAYRILAGPLRGKRFILGAAAGPAGGLSIFAGRSEPEQVAAMAGTLRAGDVLFDVGANVGFYTILASDRVGAAGRVVAFEPVMRNVAFLQRHVELNGLRNVTILPFALSRAPGYGRFVAGDTVATGHLASGTDGERADPSRETLAHLSTVDAVVGLLGLEPRVIKIDVEGAERDVLEGAAETLRRCRPTLFLSIHSDRLRDECLELLRGHGYVAEPLGGDLATATEYRLQPSQSDASTGGRS